MFTGAYRHSVDDKGRVAIPVRFRGELMAGALVTKWIDGCLGLFPHPAWDALAAKAAGLPVTDAGARAFQRRLYGTAYEVALDRQGRLVVPGDLRDYAGLQGNAGVVVVGLRDHLELWSSERWDAYSAEMDSPEVLAAHLQGLGI